MGESACVGGKLAGRDWWVKERLSWGRRLGTGSPDHVACSAPCWAALLPALLAAGQPLLHWTLPGRHTGVGRAATPGRGSQNVLPDQRALPPGDWSETQSPGPALDPRRQAL